MADVFLSYARDDGARARQVAAGLERAGFDVFWDNEIPPGQTWADYIESKLNSCGAVVVLWSVASTRSQYVREEAREGRNRNQLFPAMIDATPAPFGFGEVQAADLSDWNGQDDHVGWSRLIEALRAFLSGRAPAPVTAPPPPPKPSPAPVTPAPQATPQPLFQAQTAPAASTPAAPRPWFANPIVMIGGGLVVLLILALLLAPRAPQPMAQAPSPSPAVVSAPPPPASEGVSADVRAAAEHMSAQLRRAGSFFNERGFMASGDPITRVFSPGDAVQIPMALQEGVIYQVVALCDQNCVNLDTVLYDQDGIEVGRDVRPDNYPLIQVQPRFSATFQLRTQAQGCNAQRCFVAAQLYARPATP